MAKKGINDQDVVPSRAEMVAKIAMELATIKTRLAKLERERTAVRQVDKSREW